MSGSSPASEAKEGSDSSKQQQQQQQQQQVPPEATSQEEEGSQCPICQFIEAGECKAQHQAWTACREQAKKDDVDYVDACHDQFKAFMQCAIDNSDYYEPFLSMLLGEEEDEEAQKAQDAKEAGTGVGKA